MSEDTVSEDDEKPRLVSVAAFPIAVVRSPECGLGGEAPRAPSRFRQLRVMRAGSLGRRLEFGHLTNIYRPIPSPLGQTMALVSKTRLVVVGTKTPLQAAAAVRKKAPVQVAPLQTPAPILA
jgi:hypothetical protein